MSLINLVVHLARKPVEGTVAQNALIYDTGGLNIDATRIKLLGEIIHGAILTDPANRLGGVGFGAGFNKFSKEKFQNAPIESLERTHRLGRWPSNVILEHLPGCRCEGTKRVRGSQLNQLIERSKSQSQSIGRQTDSYSTGCTDSEGWETIISWICLPECPIAELDRQGECPSSKGNFARYFKQIVGCPEP